MSTDGVQKKRSTVNEDFELLIGESQHLRENPVIQGRYQVEMAEKVLAALVEYASSELEKEQGAFLLGQCFEEKDRAVVRIETWIKAKYAIRRRASITFTHRDWEYLDMKHEQLYPELQVVGWFHTHPGYGVFLSAYDLFIQKNFFADQYQVALVMDPLEKKSGLFLWENGEIVKGEYRIIRERPDEKLVSTDVDQKNKKEGLE